MTLQQILNEISNIKRTIATKDDIQQVLNKIDESNANIDRNFEQIAFNTEQLSDLSRNHERQEKTLETLALRSIEYESELRTLKHVK